MMSSATQQVRSAAEHGVEQASAALKRSLKLQLGPELDGAAAAPATTRSFDQGSDVTSLGDDHVRAALRLVGHVERMRATAAGRSTALAQSAIPPEDPHPRKEYGPGQFPGSFPCRNTRSQSRAASGGRRHAGRGHESHQKHDTRYRLFETNNQCAVMHYGVVCDVCETTVRGRRYKCRTCADYDLCDSCKMKGHHSNHNFECIPFPIPAALVPRVIVVCDFCDMKIAEEERHKCLECADFDLCAACFSSSRERHPHQFRPNFPRYASDAPVRGKAAEEASAVPESAVPSQKERLVVHSRVRCDACDRGITGTRYKCGNCANFDLCEDCEGKADHDEGHVFLKIRRPIALRGIGAVLPPLYAPNACQRAQQTRTVWKKISPGARDARAEGLTKAAPSVHHKETETIVPRKIDQATSTEKTTKAVGTQTPQHRAGSQEADTRGATQQTADVANPSAHLQASDSSVSQIRPKAGSGAVASSVGEGIDGVGEYDRQENVDFGASPVLAFDAPGEAEIVPTLLTGCACMHADLDGEMRQVLGGRRPDSPSHVPFLHISVSEPSPRIDDESGVHGQFEKAVVGSGGVGPDDANPITTADIEDEFIMVSPAEDVLKAVTGRTEPFTGRAEPFTGEANQGFLIASNLSGNRYPDADAKQM